MTFAAPAVVVRQALEEALCCAIDPDGARAAYDTLLAHLETAVPEYEAEMKEANDACGIRRALWLTHFIQTTEE